ncbi:mechanosensitive ion channel family protein [uncultured Robinsoniella sp.]|uniref:mechanosensitive ion channel family protein n=1 Tax=uncultured Robinsoniella sp. TaxID=904190 RepID=UPI00374E5B3F
MEDTIADQVEKANAVVKYFEQKLPGIADFGIKILIALLVFFIGSKMIKWMLKLLKKPFLRAGLEEGSVHFLNSLVKAILYILLVSGIATYLGVKEASIAALLGSMGVGIVLALKESLGNLAGGFILLLMKPFSIGDYIKEDVNDNEGTVSKIDLFYTTLLTPDNRTISIPNGSLSNTSLTNLSRQSKRQLRLVIGISYKADIRKAKEILEEILNNDIAILKEEPIEIFVDNLAASSVELGFRSWVKPEDYWPARWRIMERVKYAFDQKDINIPYNQLDVTIKNAEVQNEINRR